MGILRRGAGTRAGQPEGTALERLRNIVGSTDTAAGRAFALIIQGLILVSLVTFSVETLPGLSPRMQHALRLIEIVTVTVFSIEYVLRLIAAPRRLGFVFSFYGLIDLLAILPFYIASGIDLRSVRIFRLFRLFRIFRIARLSTALSRFGRAFISIRDEIAVFFMATSLLLYVAAVGIYYFENPAQPEQFSSVFTSLWWALITLTTVGYGDVYPVTVGGRIFTFVVLMIGLGVIAVPTALISTALGASIGQKRSADAKDQGAER